jgi:AraC-like DNA-binding protein
VTRTVDDELYRRLCRARDFIAAHHETPLTLPEMARHAALSKYHFLRSFRRAFDETPHEFLTRVRLERAQRLLALGDASVTEICFDVGFSSLGSFSSLFTRAIGRPPSRYRREMRRVFQVPGQLAHPFVPWCFVERLGKL